MVFTKKLFSPEDDGGGGGYENPFEGAKAGDFTNGFVEPETVVDDKTVAEPDKVPETVENAADKKPEDVKEPEKVAEKEPVVDVKEPEKAPEVVAPVEEVKKPEAPKFNLDDEIKKVDKYELLKKAGFDDYEINLLKYKEQTGDVTPYLEATSVDYSKMTDEQIMRHDLAAQYKGISNKALDALVQERVVDKYKLDAEVHQPDAVELGRELLKFEADKIRKGLIESQAKFKAPEKQVDNTAQKQQAEYAQKIAEYKTFVNDAEPTKALIKDKRLVFGKDDTAFNYTVADPKALVEAVENPQSIFKDLVGKDGNVDTAKFYKTKAYASNMDFIEKSIFDAGKTAGRKEQFDELQNVAKKETESSFAGEPELTPAQALARHGKFRERN